MIKGKDIEDDSYYLISGVEYSWITLHITIREHLHDENLHSIYFAFMKNLKALKYSERKDNFEYRIKGYYIKELYQQISNEKIEDFNKEKEKMLSRNPHNKTDYDTDKKKTIFNRISEYISKYIDVFRI